MNVDIPQETSKSPVEHDEKGILETISDGIASVLPVGNSGLASGVTPMPSLTGIANDLQSNLIESHKKALDMYDSYISSMHQQLARNQLHRSQTGSAFYRTGHAIANGYFESELMRLASSDKKN